MKDASPAVKITPAFTFAIPGDGVVLVFNPLFTHTLSDNLPNKRCRRVYRLSMMWWMMYMLVGCCFQPWRVPYLRRGVLKMAEPLSSKRSFPHRWKVRRHGDSVLMTKLLIKSFWPRLFMTSRTEKPQGEPDHPRVPGQENGTEQEEEEDGEEDGESCANSTTRTEMNTGQMNGDAETAAPKASPKTPSKSPSANRTGRRNQVRLWVPFFKCTCCRNLCVNPPRLQHHTLLHFTRIPSIHTLASSSAPGHRLLTN